MTQTDDLLGLMDSFPDAFEQVQSATGMADIAAITPDVDPALAPQLQQLIAEFPSAFMDPVTNLGGEDSQSELVNEDSALAETAIEEAVTIAVDTPPTATSVNPLPLAQPGTYSNALTRQISTMTWGQVELYLTYGDSGLQSMWVTVGKSGTEVQSLCEAIVRLINLLLANQIPIPDIARQIRGIRGADSEGLGPNRILGLADLIGKVLQEAPESLAPTQPTDRQEEAVQTLANNGNGSSNGTQVVTLMPTDTWTTIADHDHEASICPECGAELHQVNGCSGGACVVCGYSSCS
ncbi:ribonucleotide reductase [Acaryochloris sp. 'Moss Beach']|uniref:TSCPD domain-containing protein n=1 Tax=Acaryochloris sp. 'Moss Beach' TaxID=2740837 RepID=UPI001F20D6DF|nr:ribonucleotide reductase [Acaryochloris sp. 'Moss Beach']UJB71213.1 ribonucleotide reductase [Acaryochloris sp. 'Moss Beach']